MLTTKTKVIQEWPTPKNIGDVRNFHGLASFYRRFVPNFSSLASFYRRFVPNFSSLASFYRRFVPNFSSLASPLNELVKKDVTFHWREKQENLFQRIKFVLINAPILVVPNLSKHFELERGGSRVDIGVVLPKSGHPVAYLSEKLHGSTFNYLTYDKELYMFWRGPFKLGNTTLCPKSPSFIVIMSHLII